MSIQEPYSERREVLIIGPELASRHELLTRVAQEMEALLGNPKIQNILEPMIIRIQPTDNPTDLPRILENWTAIIGRTSRYRRKIETAHFDDLRKRIKEILSFFELSCQDKKPTLLSGKLPPPKRTPLSESSGSFSEKMQISAPKKPEDEDNTSEILGDHYPQEVDSD